MKGLPFERSLEKMDKEDPIIEILVRIHEECSQVLMRVLGAIVQPVLRRLETQRELDRRKFAVCRHGLYLGAWKVFRHNPPHARLQFSLEVRGIGLSIRLIGVANI